MLIRKIIAIIYYILKIMTPSTIQPEIAYFPQYVQYVRNAASA